jgi:hypothetical protein
MRRALINLTYERKKTLQLIVKTGCCRLLHLYICGLLPGVIATGAAEFYSGLRAAESKRASVASVCVTSLSVWNSSRDQLFNKWNSTRAQVFCVEQWNSVLLFLHQL